MTPMRMCMVCRRRADKSELLRIAATDGVAHLDRDGVAQSRGAYLCNDEACIRNAIRSRAVGRALKQASDACVYDELEGLLHE